MDGFRYREHIIKQFVKPFVDQFHADQDYWFWPDLASAHYAKETLNLFDSLQIKYIPRQHNPPMSPTYALSRIFGQRSREMCMQEGIRQSPSKP